MSCSPPFERRHQNLALRVLPVAMAVILPLLAGCPGSLEGAFPRSNRHRRNDRLRGYRWLDGLRRSRHDV